MLFGGQDAIDEVSEILTTESFYRPNHGEIFDSMLALSRRGEPLDIVTLKDELSRRGTLEGIGGTEYLLNHITDTAFKNFSNSYRPFSH